MEGLQEDIDIIKSLIAITRGGLAVDKLNKEFRDMTGSALNYRKYGFQSIFQMLQSSRDIVLSETREGTVCRVYDEKMSHVTELVERTKPSRPSKKSKSRGYAKFRPTYHSSSRRLSSPHTPQRPGYQKSLPHYERHYNQPIQQSSRPQYHNSMVPTQALASCSNSRPAMPSIQSAVVEPAVVKSASCSARISPMTTIQSSSEKPAVVKSEVHQRPQKSTQYLSKEEDNSNLRNTDASRKETVSGKESSCDQISNQRVCANKSVHYRLNLAIRKARVKEVLSRSESGSDWSSDSMEHTKFTESNSSSGWSSSSLEKSPNLRQVHLKGKETVFNSKKHSEVDSRYTKISNLKITVPNIRSQNCKVLSDSDWSSDLESPPSGEKLCRKSPPHSSTSITSPAPVTVGMVRGRGRGRLRDQGFMMTPGFRDVKVDAEGASHSQQGIAVVNGTPNKREAVASSSNGHSSIVVNVPNGRAVQNIHKPSVCTEPSYAGYQFVGDYFLLRVAEVTLGSKIVKGGLGLCRSNLTISECENEILDHGVSDKIVLMIGMTDILLGATILEMKCRMTSLLRQLSHLHLLVLSLPVPPSFIKATSKNKLSVLEAFNKWILQLPLKVIDIDCHLYTDAPFYMRAPGNGPETFSEEGCFVVIDEIISTINEA